MASVTLQTLLEGGPSGSGRLLPRQDRCRRRPQPPIITQEDLDQDVGAEIERLIRRMKSMSEQQLERQVFRQKVMYLCVPCFNRWIENPVSP